MARWNLDSAHTDIGFSTKHLMVATVKGRFTGVDAEIEIDEEQPERSSVVATIDAASLASGNDERDAHLRSADFLDVEHFPTLSFRSTSVRRVGDDELELAGDLTIRDVTKPITLRGSIGGPVVTPWGGRKAGFNLAGEIDREAFGLTWNVAMEAGGVLVGKKIKLAIDAELDEVAAEAAA